MKLPWRRKSKILAPIDHGNGLFRLPAQAPDRDDDTGQLILEWAADQWNRWETGQGAWRVGRAGTSVCPSCYATVTTENRRYMAAAHSNRAARARWTALTAKGERQVAALGPCRCHAKKAPGQAAADAVRALGSYRF